MLHFTLLAPKPCFWIYEHPVAQITLPAAAGFELNHQRRLSLPDSIDRVLGEPSHGHLFPLLSAECADGCHYLSHLCNDHETTPVKVFLHCPFPALFAPLSDHERTSVDLLSQGCFRALSHLPTPPSGLLHQALCSSIYEAMVDLFLSLDAHRFEPTPIGTAIVERVYGTPLSGDGRRDLCRVLNAVFGNAVLHTLTSLLAQAERLSHRPILGSQDVYEAFWTRGLAVPPQTTLDRAPFQETVNLLVDDLPHFLCALSSPRPLIETVLRHYHHLIHTLLRLLAHQYQGSPKMQIALYWMTQRWHDELDDLLHAGLSRHGQSSSEQLVRRHHDVVRHRHH